MKNELGRKRENDDESVHEKNKRIRGEQERRLRKELRHLDHIIKQQGDYYA